MIESSVIKLILIVILNICFVWVWVKKESLRRTMPFRIIRRLEEKAFFKKVKKLISFIGNINMFWIINILYLFVVKFFEEILNMTLDFPYGVKYIEKSIETSFFKVNYINMKTLDEIAKFLFDSGNFITLFVGLTGMLVAIYIYAVSVDNKLKKFMLITLIGKESLFYLSFYIVILFLLGIKSIFLIGPIGYLICRLTDSVKWVVNINSASSYKENFKYVMKNIFTEKDKNDLYEEVKKSLYSAVKNEELMEIEENRYYFNKYFDNYRKELNYISKDIEFGNVISFLNNLYEEVSFNKNSRIFQKINYLHIKIADYYFKNNDKDKFLRALMVMTKVYDYYSKDKNDNMELDVVSGFRFDTFGIYEQYKENFEEGIEWYCQKFKVIVEGIKRSVKNDDLYFFKQFIYLIEQEFEYKENLKRDYKLLEKTVYFGILLYLKEEKIKNKENENKIKKIDRFIEFMEKRILNDSDLIGLIDLYVFIGEEIYGYNEQSMNDRLDWDGYFRIKPELIRIKFQEVRGEDEKIKLFLELLGKINFEEWEKNKLLNEQELKGYINYKLDMENSFNYYKSDKKEKDVEGERKEIIKRINSFKKKAIWLLNDLKKYKDKIDITKENYQRLEKYLNTIKDQNQEEENKNIKEAGISLNKIKIIKEVLEEMLSNSKIIKMLKGFDKYRYKREKYGINLMGISQYMEKEYFVEIGNEGGTKAIAKSFGQAQNRLIEQIMVNKLEMEKQEIGSIEKALNSIKGKPWIILTGIDMFSFFYAENDSTMGKILVDSDLKEEEFKKYGEILEGMYKYKSSKIPIYNFSSNKKGIYILDSDDIEGFTHYDPREEKKEGFDGMVCYSYLKVTDTDEIITYEGRKKVLKDSSLKEDEIVGEKLKEYIKNIKKSEKSFNGDNLEDIIKYEGEKIILKYEFLKGDGTPEEKIEKFRQRVLISFVQRGELKLKENAVVYKVEFNG